MRISTLLNIFSVQSQILSVFALVDLTLTFEEGLSQGMGLGQNNSSINQQNHQQLKWLSYQ